MVEHAGYPRSLSDCPKLSVLPLSGHTNHQWHSDCYSRWWQWDVSPRRTSGASFFIFLSHVGPGALLAKEVRDETTGGSVLLCLRESER